MKKIVLFILVAWLYTSCNDENNVPKFSLLGEVVSVTQTRLSGVTIDIYPDGMNTPLETLKTNDKGLFSISLEHGTYQIQAVSDGYQVYKQTITVDDSTAPLSISLHGQAVISGRIVNSQT